MHTHACTAIAFFFFISISIGGLFSILCRRETSFSILPFALRILWMWQTNGERNAIKSRAHWGESWTCFQIECSVKPTSFTVMRRIFRRCSEKKWLNRIEWQEWRVFFFSNPFASPWRIQNIKLYIRHSHTKTILIQKHNLFWFGLNEPNKGPEKGGKNPLNRHCLRHCVHHCLLPYFSLRNRLNGSNEKPTEFVVYRNLWSNRRTEWKDAHCVLRVEFDDWTNNKNFIFQNRFFFVLFLSYRPIQRGFKVQT